MQNANTNEIDELNRAISAAEAKMRIRKANSGSSPSLNTMIAANHGVTMGGKRRRSSRRSRKVSRKNRKASRKNRKASRKNRKASRKNRK